MLCGALGWGCSDGLPEGPAGDADSGPNNRGGASGATTGSTGGGGASTGGTTGSGGTTGGSGGTGTGGTTGGGGGSGGSTGSGGTTGGGGAGAAGRAGNGGQAGGGQSGSGGQAGSAGGPDAGASDAGTQSDAPVGDGSTPTSDAAPTDGGATCGTVRDFAAAGPFMTAQEAGGATCTIYRPNPMGATCKHPVIVWGNGTGASPATYQAVLTHWASHGFIVAAANTSSAGTGNEMVACLDWVIQQSTTSGSAFFGKVDASHVGASGHSQGGGGTIMTGRDARVTVTAPLQPYTTAGFGGFSSASIGQQKGAMFLMSGSSDTIASPTPNQKVVYDGINVPVFWGTLKGADHLVTGTGNIGGYRGPSTAWFRLHLMGDESGRSLFYGASCGLCSDAMWTVQRKGIQ